MVKISRFLLHSDFATFKNEIGMVELSITVPANVVVPAGSPYGLYTAYVEAELGSPGSAIIARGKSSRNMVDFPTPTVIVPANTWLTQTTIAPYRQFTGASPGTNLWNVVAIVGRSSPTTVRLTVNIANVSGESKTGEGTAETFTFQVWTNLSPFRDDI